MRVPQFLSLLLLLLSISSARAAPGIEALSFMAGHWIAPANDNAEEVWLAPAGGTISGSFRWLVSGGPQVFELLLIQETEAGIFLRFKHYDAAFKPWETEPNLYELTDHAPGRAVFTRRSENDSVPELFIYQAPNPDALHFEGRTPGKDSLILKFERKK